MLNNHKQYLNKQVHELNKIKKEIEKTEQKIVAMDDESDIVEKCAKQAHEKSQEINKLMKSYTVNFFFPIFVDSYYQGPTLGAGNYAIHANQRRDERIEKVLQKLGEKKQYTGSMSQCRVSKNERNLQTYNFYKKCAIAVSNLAICLFENVT